MHISPRRMALSPAAAALCAAVLFAPYLATPSLADQAQPPSIATDSSSEALAQVLSAAEAAWARSCPRPGTDGLCLARVETRSDITCSGARVRVTALRRPKQAAAARKQLRQVLALAERQGTPEVHRAAGTARLYLAEDLVESTMAIAFPDGLTFALARPAARHASEKRFKAWFQKTSTSYQEAHAALAKVSSNTVVMAEPWAAVHALARAGQIYERFAELLETADIPADLRTGEHASEKRRVYCEALLAHSGRLREQARQAFAICADKAASLGVKSPVVEICASRQ